MADKVPRKLAVVGVGAFGEFMIPHLLPYFHVSAFEPVRDIGGLVERFCVTPVTFEEVADAEIVVLAPPVQEIESVAERLAPLLRPGTLVLDVCSVKVQPLDVLSETLPDHCDIVGTHPLFGPQSGKRGIAGLNVAVCEVRGGKGPCVAAFLRDELGLNAVETTPDEHDRQMAYVQGLTHLLSKILLDMKMPPLDLTTVTFEHLRDMIEIVRYDSESLFRAIENRNPYVADVRRDFFGSAASIGEALERKPGGK